MGENTVRNHEQDRPQMEFHISRTARDRHQFDESLFSLRGKVIFANFHAARLFAQRINDRRDVIHFPERAVKATWSEVDEEGKDG